MLIYKIWSYSIIQLVWLYFCCTCISYHLANVLLLGGLTSVGATNVSRGTKGKLVTMAGRQSDSDSAVCEAVNVMSGGSLPRLVQDLNTGNAAATCHRRKSLDASETVTSANSIGANIEGTRATSNQLCHLHSKTASNRRVYLNRCALHKKL